MDCYTCSYADVSDALTSADTIQELEAMDSYTCSYADISNALTSADTIQELGAMDSYIVAMLMFLML